MFKTEINEQLMARASICMKQKISAIEHLWLNLLLFFQNIF